MLSLGYYFADSRFGEHLSEVESYTSFTFCEGQTGTDWWYHRTKRGFVKALQDAKAYNLRIHLSFQDSDPAKIVRLAAPVWDSIELIDVMDEPPLKLKAMNERCNAIDDAVFEAGLRPKPVGAVLTASQLRNLNGWRSPYLEWRGIEAYIDAVKFQHSKALAVRECKRALREQLDIIDDNKPIVIVLQSFVGKQNTWTNMESLVAVQHAAAEVAFTDKRVTHLRAFNYGRKDGARTRPELIAAHRAIARKAKAA